MFTVYSHDAWWHCKKPNKSKWRNEEVAALIQQVCLGQKEVIYYIFCFIFCDEQNSSSRHERRTTALVWLTWIKVHFTIQYNTMSLKETLGLFKILRHMKTVVGIVLLPVFSFLLHLSHQLTVSGKFCRVMHARLWEDQITWRRKHSTWAGTSHPKTHGGWGGQEPEQQLQLNKHYFRTVLLTLLSFTIKRYLLRGHRGPFCFNKVSSEGRSLRGFTLWIPPRPCLRRLTLLEQYLTYFLLAVSQRLFHENNTTKPF